MEISQKTLEKFQYMKLPSLYYQRKFDEIPDHATGEAFKYKEVIGEYLKSIPTTQGLYLHGREYGHGKSSIAAIILKAFAAKYMYGYWLSYKNILDLQFDDTNPDKKRMWQCPVLIIDEFDPVESRPENTARKLIEFENLLRYRYTNQLVNIVTSNLTMNQKVLEKYPGLVPIASVLSDCTTPVKIYGKNWRKK